MMIAEARQIGDQRGGFAVGGDAKDAPTFEFSAFGNIEITILESDSGPRSVAASVGDFGDLPVSFNAQQARFRPFLTVGVTGLDDTRIIAIIESHASRKSQAGSNCLNSKARVNGD